MTNQTIADGLRNERIAHGLTLSKVASSLGLSINHLCNLEQGKRRWYADTMLRYEKLLAEHKPEPAAHHD